jgi:iron(III) transport system permease protein
MSTAVAHPQPDPPVVVGGPVVAARRRARSWILLGLSVLVAAVLAAPLLFLLLQARDAGWSTVWQLIWRPLTWTLMWNTIRLTVVVTLLCAVIGTLAAWFVECTDLPLRRVWAVLVVIPFAIPDFVIAFGWSSLSPSVQGFRGAVLIMTLAVYPLVYLPVAASFRSADPAQEEAARSLGLGRLQTFVRVTLRQARGAILGGSLLVTLVILAEYGAFEILGYATFTTEIFTELQSAFSLPTAAALSLVLVILGVLVVGGDMALQGRSRMVRTGLYAQRVNRRHALGRWTAPVLAAFTALVVLALGVPIGSCVYWMMTRHGAPVAGSSMLSAAENTAGYSAAAGLLATAMAFPVALYAVRYGGRAARILERGTYLVMSMPGVVIALALSYFVERYAAGFGYQTAAMLVVAYAILFFPLALVGVRASVAYAPIALEETARSLGAGRLEVFRRVTLPLVGPGLAAAFCLVFLAAITELTATLLLIPTGAQTLSTQFWAYEQNLSYGQAAPFALAIIAVAAIPSYVIARYFDRLPARAARSK